MEYIYRKSVHLAIDRLAIVITLILILTLKPDPYPNPSHNPTYHNKPTETYQTVLTVTDIVGLQCALRHRHTQQYPLKNQDKPIIIRSPHFNKNPS